MIEQGIQQLITVSPDFQAIAATRLYPVLLPTDCLLPAATYQVISTTPLYTLEDRVDVTKMRLQIDVWGLSYADVKSLAAVIISQLDGFYGLLPDGTNIFGVQLHSSRDEFEHDALIYRVFIQFDIQFTA